MPRHPAVKRWHPDQQRPPEASDERLQHRKTTPYHPLHTSKTHNQRSRTALWKAWQTITTSSPSNR
ncbi:hypothetical protein [Marinobacter shengliensis]|uniref:hypothetical protein n=1 Tax=Marinobacter shengliensis TaxID=1389223 RepID=UPI00142E4C26|nr:hypothetical protein [Marinobacter shengliensis]